MATRGLMTPQSVAISLPDTPKYKIKDAIPESGVCVVLGAQGEGKTSFAMWMMELMREQSNGERAGAVYMAPPAMRRLMPDWVEAPRQLRAIPRDSVVVIDEAQQIAHSRRSASKDNLDLANLVALSRQRNQLIFLVTHHTRKLDVLTVTDAKRIIYKKPAAGHVMMERKEFKPFAGRAYEKFQQQKGKSQKWAYVMDFNNLNFGFIQAKMPSFWSEELSCGMADLGTAGAGSTLLG